MHLGHLMEYDLIGIGSPVIAGSLAPNMVDFIHSFPSLYKTHLFNTGVEKHPAPEQKKHAFIFITHGLHPGEAMKRAWETMQKKDKCDQCGLCVEHCPMDAIDLESNPAILPNCSWCILCEMICPRGAVDIGIEQIKKDRGEPPSREFINWAVDLHNRIQNQLEPEQRLRMLIPMKEVYTQYYAYDVTTNPRVVILEHGWKDRHQVK
jgi:ferredoxin